MSHFVEDDRINLFRLCESLESRCIADALRRSIGLLMCLLATSWQFLTNNQANGAINAGNVAKYDQLVQACLSTGAYCIIDLHNFARLNGGIIGQGGPSDDAFVALWTALASKYAGQQNIIFELMNEPHDLDMPTWATTCQKVVSAIRSAGAKSQMILLPGTNFDSAGEILSSGSADALLAITNPDGGTDGLVLDVHKYLDVDNSGTHATCTTNNTDAFGLLAEYLRGKGRLAFIGETGASHDPTVSCPLVLSMLAATQADLPRAVHDRLLRAERFHQCQLGRLRRSGSMGRRQLQHIVPPQSHAEHARWQAR
jgi:aryl-phospho-beta-D-glucosidase BglC (GH1 family)